MSGTEPRQGVGKGLGLAIAAALVVGLAAAVYVIAGSALKPADAPKAAAGLQTLAKGDMGKLQISPDTPPPAKGFVDADGKSVHLQDMRGEVLVVNLWATWCAPCKKEMPTLAALAKAYEGKPVKVVAISIDKEGQTQEAKDFIAANAPLDFYQDATMELPFEMKPPAAGFPTTIFYDRNGLEKARISGEADWSGPDAKAVVDYLIAN